MASMELVRVIVLVTRRTGGPGESVRGSWISEPEDEAMGSEAGMRGGAVGCIEERGRKILGLMTTDGLALVQGGASASPLPVRSVDLHVRRCSLGDVSDLQWPHHVPFESRVLI